MSGARTLITALAMIICLASCNRRDKHTGAVQKTFASPADAGAAVFEAAKSGDQNALLVIFGPDAKAILFTGDPVTDRANMEDFVSAYGQMNRWGKIKAGGEILYIGADNYPFPIPLGQNAFGRWYFDTAAGRDEILARRIGKEELTAIAACQAVAGAEQEYFRQAHDGDRNRQFAQKLVSNPGRQNGLYWQVLDGEDPSPLGRFGDFGKVLGAHNAGAEPEAFNGYYYRILTKQGDKAKDGAKDYVTNGKMTGGFAILAFPREYRRSGIMSFIVGPDGIVYQKDLGEKTADVAALMSEYNPGDGWSPAVQPSEASS
jgi:hypothetical protein